ncbi:MAG: MFS transporter [Verrucomicrobiae bacterium]|nr:MFS transporter [Verrucomicrobiae bacterium]
MVTDASLASRLLAGFRALRHAGYRRLWIGSLLSNTGSFMQMVAQGWLVYQLTDSAFMLGLVPCCAALPITLLTPLGGAAADRHDRRRILLVSQSVMTAAALILAVMIWTQTVTIWAILAMSTLTGVAVAFNNPAYQALLLELVGRDDLPNAIALSSLAFNASRLLGPTLAAATLTAADIGWCYFLNGLSFFAVIIALWRIRDLPAREMKAGMALLENLRDALRFLGGQPVMRALLLLTAAYSLLCFPQMSVLPVFARDVLGIGADGLGWMVSCFGAGGVLSSLILALLSEVPWRGRLYLASAVSLALMLVLLGLSRNPALSLTLMTLLGAAHVQTVVNNNTMLQRLMPDDLRGRLLSLHFLAFLGLMPLGNLLAGTLAHHLGAQRSVMITGVCFALCVVVASLRQPKLRTLA